MTLAKLAELSGTSVGTVSKAFSGSREVGEKTRERIFALARQYGCFEKYYKAPRQRPVVALLCPEPESEYYGKEIGLLERALYARGADAIIAFTRFQPHEEARLFYDLAYRMKVDGVIVWGSGRMIKNSDEIPLVVMSNSLKKGSNADVVRVDVEGGMLCLMETIKAQGHTEIGFIGEHLTVKKEEYFKNAMRRIGFPIYDRYVVRTDGRFAEAGEEGIKRMIERGALPSVIIAAYDQIAFGAMRYVKHLGYRIPQDISFIGMDDISATSYLDIPLSSLHSNLEDVCAQMVDLIFKRIENKHYRERVEITVPVTLKLRESFGVFQKQ